MSEPQKDTEPKYQPVHTNKVGGSPFTGAQFVKYLEEKLAVSNG